MFVKTVKRYNHEVKTANFEHIKKIVKNLIKLGCNQLFRTVGVVKNIEMHQPFNQF